MIGHILSLAPWFTIILTALLWIFNNWRDRKQERFKKLIDYRITVLSDLNTFFDDLIEFIELGSPTDLKKDEIQKKLYKLRREMQQYGYDQEITLFEQFAGAYFRDKDTVKANSIMKELIPLITNNIRKELGLDKTNVNLSWQ